MNFVERIVLDAACKPIPVPEAHDEGVDGLIEFPNDAGARLIAFQAKRGDSFFDVSGPRCQTDARHLSYWGTYPLAVVLIIVREDGTAAFWMDARQYVRDHPEIVEAGPFVLRPPQTQVFDVESLLVLIQPLALAGDVADLQTGLRPPPAVLAGLPHGLEEATQDVLGWQQELPGGTWLSRPEMDQVRRLLDGAECRTTVLLGIPGSGKSAFLARLGSDLRKSGWNVVAIKADRLPRKIATLNDLATYLQLSTSVVEAIRTLKATAKTVLLVDQLDALSDLVDLHTERLAVLLSLISRVHAVGVPVVCSARQFDFQHDCRFAQLDADEVNLTPIAEQEVDSVLRGIGFEPSRATATLKSLLAVPHWLKLFMRLSWSGQQQLPVTSQALMEAVWEQTVLQPAALAAENDATASEVAKLISETEELWISRAKLVAWESALQRLLAAGILNSDAASHRLSFSHQSLYEFARARAFVRAESLGAYVLRRQDSLFVRPAIWTALHYLRAADPPQYLAELTGLWDAAIRAHVRLLLIEFVAQLPDPQQQEIALLLPVFSDPAWARTAFVATIQSESWLRILRRGTLQTAMLGDRAADAYAAVVASLRLDRDETLALISRLWRGKPEKAGLLVGVLRQLETWSVAARDLLGDALPHIEGADDVLDTFAWQLKARNPDYAIDLVVGRLQRNFDVSEGTLPRSPPLADDAPLEERFRWYANREPAHTVQGIFRSASDYHVLIELAEAEPEHFLRGFLPWVARVLGYAAELDPWHPSYRVDQVCDCARGDGPVRELPHAMRAASELLAQKNAAGFMALFAEWTSSDLHAIHVIFSYGLEKVAHLEVGRIVDYLVADARRLHLGESGDPDARTVALLSSIGASVSADHVRRLELAIDGSQRSSESLDRDVKARTLARRLNREHRLRLLRTLPSGLLSASTAGLVEQELRVFGDPEPRTRSFRLQPVLSPMSSQQMERAADEHIVRLFEELPDGTRFRRSYPEMQGGAEEAGRELAAMAKRNPERAIKIVSRLRPGQNETPVGDVVSALAETAISTQALYDVVAACDERGFSSEQFRTDAARALAKRAGKGLPEAARALLLRWLSQVPMRDRTAPRAASEENTGEPPFLFGHGGYVSIPGGSYSILDTLLVDLLSSEPPRAQEWLATLVEHLRRDEDPLVWRAFAHRLDLLRMCEHASAVAFLDDLFARYPEALESRHGVELVALASWWAMEAIVERWLAVLETSSWQHARHAVGELVAFLATRASPMAWAEIKLNAILTADGRQDERVGAAHALMGLWRDAEKRPRVVRPLCELIRRGQPVVDEVILARLGHDEFVSDEPTQDVLSAFAGRAAPLPIEQARDAASWLAKVVHVGPRKVHSLVVALVSSAGSDATPRLGGSAVLLVNIAVTLQRTPGLREPGLALFERLLALDLYGARGALEAIDVGRYRT